MLESGLKKKDRRDKSIVDMVSAAIILQSFLEIQSFNLNRNGSAE
jgi:RNase H-fold protein (predicted Holliday junction resolvase)